MIGTWKQRINLSHVAWCAWACIVTAGCLVIPPDLIQGGGGGGGGFTGDGDRISTAVEMNDANSFHNFDTLFKDEDPSRAFGRETAGTLWDGINLPDRQRGYYHFYGSDLTDRDDWGTLTLVNLIEGVARKWTESGQPCRILDYGSRPPEYGVGDLSKGNKLTRVFGGQWDHTSHENGLDVDLRYLRLTSDTGRMDLSTSDSFNYDPQVTMDLLSCFLSFENVTKIFLDTALAHVNRQGNARLVHDPAEHYHHFHVRIRDPDGLNN
jgi:hypothetical protein